MIIAALIVAALVVACAAAGALYRAYPAPDGPCYVAMTRNTIRSWAAPKGAITTEFNPAYNGVSAFAGPAAAANPPRATGQATTGRSPPSDFEP